MSESRRASIQFLPLLSVLIAVTALLYSTWRNETTEAQRSLREASFAVLERLTELEGYVFVLAYTEPGERSPETPFLAWSTVRELHDMGRLLPDVADGTDDLFNNWQAGFAALDGWSRDKPGSVAAARRTADELSDEIQALRHRTIEFAAQLH